MEPDEHLPDRKVGPGPRARRALLALLLLALAPRLALVAAPEADLFRSGRQADIFVGEEISRGNVAREVLEGPLLPVIDYQYAHFFGGSLVTGLLAVPSFALLGPNLFALKLVPILFHLLALAALFALLDARVSRRAAWIGGLLFAWSAPGYTLLSTVAWGSHVESNALALGCVWLWYRIVTRSEAGGRARFGLGLAQGFALYFGYQCALFVAALLALDLARDRRFLARREAWLQVAGGLVGFAPWLAYNLRNGFAGLTLYGRSLGERMTAGEGPLERLASLAREGLPGSAWFPGALGASGAVLGALFFAVLFALAIPAVRVPRAGRIPTPGTLAWTYLALFAVAFALSDFPIGHKPEDVGSYRYAMLAYPWLVMAAACGAERLLAGTARARVPVLAAVALTACAGLAGTLAHVDSSRWGASWRAPGYNTSGLGGWIAARFVHRPEVYDTVVTRALERRDAAQREQLFDGLGKTLWSLSRARPGADAEAVAVAREYEEVRQRLLTLVPEEYVDLFER